MAKHTCIYIHVHSGCIHGSFSWLNIEDDQYNDRHFYTGFSLFFNDNPSFGKWDRKPRDVDDLISFLKRDMWID